MIKDKSHEARIQKLEVDLANLKEELLRSNNVIRVRRELTQDDANRLIALHAGRWWEFWK